MEEEKEREKYKFDSIEDAIEAIKKGEMVIVVDDEDRENEGDLTMAGQFVTAEAINFMAQYGRGLICAPITEEIAKKLDLEMMVKENTAPYQTAFTVSVDARYGTTTGISAYDRARTIRVLADPNSKPSDLVKPGHIFPLIAKKGGVLKRAGQTEAAVDLAILAGLYPVGVICEIMNPDGTMARVPQLMEFKKTFGLKIITVADLISYRIKNETLVERIAETILPTRFGTFKVYAYRSKVDNQEHIALVKGEINPEEPVLVRVHSSCVTGDIFHSLRCDCGQQLERALQMIEKEGKGVFVYMYQEGRGIGLGNKLKAYMLQDKGIDTVEANIRLGFKPDQRDYGIGAQILRHIGVRKIRLLTNNIRKYVALKGYGLTVVERVPIEIEPNDKNFKYLKTKKEKLGHLLSNV